MTSIVRVIPALGLVFSLAACSPPHVTDGHEALQRAVVGVGFPCTEVVDARRFDESGQSARVACRNAEVYLAWAGDGGELCFEPVVYGDPTSMLNVEGSRESITIVMPDGQRVERGRSARDAPAVPPRSRCVEGAAALI